MRALLLILIASSALGQGRFDRVNKRTDQGRSSRGLLPQSGAFFEFAPASGAGMGTACACAAVTGAKGEALTLTRTGDATCSKQGLATTGIANGDLVTCTANQPRVESSGGVLGLRVESARTNSVLRSEEFDNAAWLDVSSPAATPTVTANAGTSPRGDSTADRVQFVSRTAGQYSVLGQTIVVGGTGMVSVYVRGVSGSGTISLLSDGAFTSCVDYSFTDSSWTRIDQQMGGNRIYVGTVSGFGACAGGTKPAADVYLWGAQGEDGARFSTSYIPTTSAAVTRNADAPTVSLGSGTWGCEAASFSVAGYNASGSNQRVLALAVDASNLYDQYINFSGASLQHFTFLSATTRQHATSNAPAVAGAVSRAVYRQNGTTLVTELDGTTTTSTPSAYTALTGAATLHLGKYTSGGFELSGIISRIQVDPSPSRCTP